MIIRNNKWSTSISGPVQNVNYSLWSCCDFSSTFILDDLPMQVFQGCVSLVNGLIPFIPNDPPVVMTPPLDEYGDALSKLVEGDYSGALGILERIVDAEIPNATSHEIEVQELSYKYIKYAIGEMYNQDILDNSGIQVNPTVESLLAIQDKKLQEVVSTNNIELKYSISMDKAPNTGIGR